MTFDPTSAQADDAFDPTSAQADTGTPDTRTVLRSAVQVKPDDAAEVARLRAKYPQPADVLLRNLADVRLQEAVLQADERLKTSPKLAERMRNNPWLAKQAHDDIPALTQVAQFVGDLGRAAEATVYSAGRGAAGTFRAVAELVAPLADALEVDPADPAFKDDWRRALGGNPLRRLAEGFGIQAGLNEQDAAAVRPKGNNWLTSGIFSGIESLGQNLMTLPIALVNPAAGLAAMGAFTGGSAYEDARAKGLPMEQALPFAASQAAIEIATEKLPLGKLLEDVKAGTPFFQTLVRQIGAEIPGEQLATVLQDLNEWAVLHPEKPFSDYLEERPSAFAQTLVATIVGAGGNIAIAKTIETAAARVLRDGGQMQQAGAFSQALEQALKGAASSALRERNPEEFRKLVADLSDNGTVYVDAEVLNQMPADVLQKMEGVAAELPAALAARDTVAVRLADAMTLLAGTPQADLFMQHARIRPDAPSAFEAEEAGKNAGEFLKQESERVLAQAKDQEAARADSDAVRQILLDQLVSGNFTITVNGVKTQLSPAVAEGYAIWASAFYTTMAARTGTTAQELYARAPLRVLRKADQNAGPVIDQSRPGRLDNIEAYHYSKAARPEISTHAFGTGLAGDKRDAYLSATDKRRRQRAYFYVDKGTGINPEAGVGGVGHRVNLSNIYDANADPLRLRGAGGQDAFETRVLDAGFAGYLDRLDGGQSGQVILLGDQTVKPEVLGPLTKTRGRVVPPPAARPAFGRDVIVDRLAARKDLPAGEPEMAMWERMLKALDPEAAVAMREAGVFDLPGKFYKDGLLRAFIERTPDPVYAQSVSTRLPTGKKATENPLAEQLVIGFDTVKRNPTLLDKFATKLDAIKSLKTSRSKDPAKRIESYIGQMVDNLLWLHDQVPAEIRNRSKLWYDGARAIVDRWVDQYGGRYTDVQLSAVLAVMSPKMDWFTNVTLGERIVDIWDQRQDFAWSAEMTAAAEKTAIVGYAEQYARIQGKTLAELNGEPDANFLQALWLVAYDRAYNPKEFRVVTPEGDFADLSRIDSGSPAKAAWGNGFGPVAKAIAVLKDGSIANVSGLLGNAHKVRNFYNNIFAPNATDGSVTADTHAVAAALLSPLSQSSPEVEDNFGAAGSDINLGISGTYPIYAEAYRRAAKQRGILPREMQSITWEAVRGLFSPAFKSKYKANKKAFDAIWKDFYAGNLDIDQARQRIVEFADNIDNPDWYRPGDAGAADRWSASYAGELLAPGGVGGTAGPGARADAAAGTATLAQDGGLTDGQAGDRGGRYSSGGLAPLEGAPAIAGAAGPDPRLVAVAEQYARDNGIDLRRQVAYVEVDVDRARRIAAAYDAMPHAPNDPTVREAYQNLIRQTIAQYKALVAAGYKFWFMDPANDPYAGNPWNAMRDLRANQSMAVFPTEAGFGTGGQVNIGLADPNGGPNIPPEAVLEALRIVGAEVETSAIFDSDTEPTLVVKLKKALTKEQGDFLSGLADQEAIAQRTDDEKGALFGKMAEKWGPFNPTYFVTPSGVRADEIANPLLQDTGITWPFGSPDGEQRPVLANDLFRAVHDAFGHGLEGAGFRAQGEENAWQAHVRLFTGSAVGAITSETRGQNSWLNYGPHGETNQTAKVEDTVFADQKTGLMPEWTWTEGRADDAPAAEPGRAQPAAVEFDDALLDQAIEDLKSLDAVARSNVQSDAHGVIPGKQRQFDVGLARGDYTEADVQRAFAPTLDAIRSRFGDVVTLWRADALASEKTSNTLTVYMAGEDMARRFATNGREAKPYSISVDDILMVYAKPSGYYEVIVRRGALDNQTLAQGPRGTFNPRTLELVLNEGADLSTFFHETGHFFLEVMADLASQPGAPAQIADDMAKILAWFGVPDLATWNAMTLDQKRLHHERWAESIEQYVMEGKAPSIELQGPMRRYAAWIKSVYKSIKQFLAMRGMATGGAVLGQSGNPYGNAPSSLLGYRKNGPQKAFGTSRFRHVEYVRVTFDGGASLVEAMDGLNKAHALERARRNWQGAKITPISQEEAEAADPGITAAVEDARYRQGADATPGPQLNDDIRRVMDRMLATDEQIAQANEAAGMAPDEDADAEAAERLNKRSMADLKWAVAARDKVITKLRKQARAIEKDIRQQVEVEVDATPEMRAKAALDALKVDPEHQGRLDAWKAERDAAEKAARTQLQDELLAANPEAKGLAKGQLLAKNKREIGNKVDATMIQWERANPRPARTFGGTEADVATIADSFGFESVDKMLEAIDAFGPRADAIDSITQRRMLEEHGDLVDEDAIRQAANEAVHNEARARSLATELRTQREMLNTRQDTGEVNAKGSKITVNALVEAAKQFGAQVVGRTPLADLKNRGWQHTAAERRAAKRWADATAAGKTEEAVKAKQDQLLNNAAAKAALEARVEAKKILDFFKRVAKGNSEDVVEKGRDADVVNAARAVLAAYGFTTATTKTADAYLEAVAKHDPETFNVIKPMVEGALRNAMPIDSLTFDQLQALRDDIDALWHLAKRMRQMEVAGNLIDIEEAADEMHARMVEIGIPDTVPGEAGAVTKAEERARFLQFARALLRRVEQWTESMDGRWGGPFSRFVFQPIKQAADAYRADAAAYRKRYQALVDSIAPSLRHGLIEAPELGYTFGRGHNGIGSAELLHAILHTGNESNKRKLLLGRQWAEENADGTLDTRRWDAFITRMINEGRITKAHYDFAQGVWDLLEETKPLAQKAHRDVFGRYFDEVTADAFVTPFGSYRGGYVPAQADPLIVQDADLRALAEAENENMAYSFPTTSKGFTKSRVEYNRPLKLDLRTIPQHLDKVLLFSHMEPAVRGVSKLLRNRGVAQALGRIDPAAYSGMLLPWLNRSARQQVETPIMGDGRVSRVLSVLRSRAGAALMFANVSNALQQVTGLANARVLVQGKHLRAGVAQMIAHPKKTREQVAAASQFMARRMDNEAAAMHDAMNEILLNPSLYERAQAWAARNSYFLQSAMDNAIGPMVWIGAYNQALAEGQSEEGAVAFADGVVRKTQGSTLPEDVSRIETGPAYARLFTQFIGYFNMMANTNGTALAQIAREVGLKKGAGKALGVVFFGMLAPIWAAEVIAQLFKGGPDDDDGDGYLDDWLAAVFGMGTIKGTLAQIPFVAQAGQLVINQFNTNPADDRFSLSPAVSLLESAVRVPHDAYKAIVGEGNAQRLVRDSAALVSIATGLPAAAAARPLGYAAGVAEGRIDPTGPADAARGLVTGVASPDSKQR